jgi:hypothetical protein
VNRQRLTALVFCITLAAIAPLALAAPTVEALRIIPGDSVAVGSVNLGALRTSPLSGRIFDETDKMTCDGDVARFLGEAGLDPARDVDVVTVAVRPRQDGRNGDALVVAEGRFDSQRIIAALVARGVKPTGTNNGAYYMLPEEDDHEGRSGAIAFISDGFAVIGSEDAVKGALNAVARGGAGFPDTPLGSQLARVDTAAQAWMVVDVERMSRLAPHGEQGSSATIFAAVKKMTYAGLWTTDTGTALSIGGVALSEDAETRELLEDAIRGALASARLAAQEKDPELVKVLRQATVSRDGEGVRFGASIPAEFLERLHQGGGEGSPAAK